MNGMTPDMRDGTRGGSLLPALCNLIGTLMLLAVILTALPLAVPRYLGWEVYNVVSGSMEPAIPVGSVIFVSSLPPEEVQAGDVIAFRTDGEVVTHRVVENRVVVGEYVTKGDANAGEDLDTVAYADLVGRVERHYPVAGSLLALYASPVGKLYVLAFAACGVMFHLLAGRMRDRQRRRTETDRPGAEPSDLAAAEPRETPPDAGAKRRKRGRIVRRVAMALLLAVFLFSAGTVVTVRRQYRLSDELYDAAAERYTTDGPAAGTGAAAPERTVAPITVDFDALRAVNGDVAGWIYCEGTVINYPVLHGADNDDYLHHSYDGTYNAAGSIFVEAENGPDFADGNTIVYGHHMNNGSMFAGLEAWASQDYYEAHPAMWLLTPEQDYKIVLLAGYTTSAFSEAYTIFRQPGPELTAYIEAAIARSDFRSGADPDPAGRYVMLSTCAYAFDYARYVIHGILIPVDSAGGVPLA